MKTLEESKFHEPYELRISRLTVDKLGVKLYDKVSAVVAELVANSYDADAEKVTIRLPLSTRLAHKDDKGRTVDRGYTIEVEDDGHGMTPDEAIAFYLQVGRDRRQHEEQGARSRHKERPVMGRKGIGKLAPFGICRIIEVISAGGDETPQGYLVAHFSMDYDEILSDTDKRVKLEAGEHDMTYRKESGTLIRLKAFSRKVVPDADIFHRQLAARFSFGDPKFDIWIEDNRRPGSHYEKVEPLSIPVVEETRIDLSNRPVTTEDGQELPVTGWLAMAKDPYKHEEMAGVRIYTREKLAATTRDFEQPAGFTGEFTIRSYLVGEVVAEWLDLDDGEDLVRSDRQGILWDSDYGRALRKWGASLIKEIGAKSRAPRREKTQKRFLEISGLEERAKERYPQKEVVAAAVDLGGRFGAFAAEDELEDEAYVADLSEIILSVAPHRALIEAFHDFSRLVSTGGVSMDDLLDLFGKTRVAEMASYGQIVTERVRTIRELEYLLTHAETNESELQNLLAGAPWLIEPTWSVITRNQALKTFKTLFEAYWRKEKNEEIVVEIGTEFERKRPDFTAVSVGHKLHIVEIKVVGHDFDDDDYDRLINYVWAFQDFFEAHPFLLNEFSKGWVIDLIADGDAIRDRQKQSYFEVLKDQETIVMTTWGDFLTRTRIGHERFLEVSNAFEAYRSELEAI